MLGNLKIPSEIIVDEKIRTNPGHTQLKLLAILLNEYF